MKSQYMSEKRATSTVTHLNYETQKMDVKTTYLNNNLDERIYMMQLDGFIAKG